MKDAVVIKVRGQMVFSGNGTVDGDGPVVFVLSNLRDVVFLYHLTPGQYARFTYNDLGCTVTVDD